MRDHIVLFLNGSEVRVRGEESLLPLSEWLRRRKFLTGTKVVCSEGDCGACSVLVGRWDATQGGFKYRTVDSCIAFPYQMDGAHLVTVEGLSHPDGSLHPVQQAMVKCFGSQCGFCTPGFVMSMAGQFEAHKDCSGRRSEPLGHDELRRALGGNLCRCTGYVQILEAGESIDPAHVEPLSARYPDAQFADRVAALSNDDVRVDWVDEECGPGLMVAPTTLEAAVAFRTVHPQCTVVAGATDVGVLRNKGKISPRVVLSLGRVRDLDAIDVSPERLVCGARATWRDLEEALRDYEPSYHRILALFGSPQIRTMGTIGGNFANASPIADSLPFHFVMDSEIEVLGPGGQRTIPISEFYLGYKKLALKPGELISRIFTPLPAHTERLRLYKVSRRKDMDISTFTAAIRVGLDGDQITLARIAMGGVGPVVLRLRKTEEFLAGKTVSEDLFAEAGRIASGEITPISDVRGSDKYRRQLAENVIRKFHWEALVGERDLWIESTAL